MHFCSCASHFDDDDDDELHVQNTRKNNLNVKLMILMTKQKIDN